MMEICFKELRNVVELIHHLFPTLIVGVVLLQTCHTEILGFLEKFRGGFEELIWLEGLDQVERRIWLMMKRKKKQNLTDDIFSCHDPLESFAHNEERGDTYHDHTRCRSISDNILLTQDIMHNYHSNRGPPRCAFKIDIQKAYDTGDPMSPYLFTLVMEILTLILKRRIREDDEFKYHNRCEKQKIVNIFFADDLILFARGDVHSANIIMEGLEEFKGVSGLLPSIPKSTIFLCNVPDQVKTSILQIMPFEEGKLPIKYLGVPLISSRLLHKDCKILVERVQKRIGDWKNKWLSFAGCHQLVLFVISSMHLYWASVFILLVGIIHDIEQLMCGFLWFQGGMKRGKAKVSWDDVCLPKCEGGLGIRKLADFNIALMSAHIWNILTHKETLWVRWIHAYKLKTRSFWDNVSWGWRKLLTIRSIIRPFIWFELGNGCKASAWFDMWDTNGLVMSHIMNRAISSVGFTTRDNVANVVHGTDWKWPQSWFMRFLSLVSISWQSIRQRSNEVGWYRLVWSKYGIPGHSIHLWLVMKRRLKTQDRLRQWGVGNNVNLNVLRCSLCNLHPDSHDHLFFECSFSSKVWSIVRKAAEMPSISLIWNDIIKCNNRIHSKPSRNEDQVAKIIVEMVRLKLASINFKNKERVRLMKAI
ncbi:putative RNA-directed DNA polymerase [Tanacetum coccineum]